MSITASMVKDLREKTGAGMMDCKKALVESEGDLEKAVDWLRQKGLAKAAKRADRAATEGIIGLHIAENGQSAVLVEVKCETDFVARGEKFLEFAQAITQHSHDNYTADNAEMLAQAFGATTLADAIAESVATIGENILVGRAIKASVENGVVGAYVHSNGKLAALVELEGCTCDGAKELARSIAMQVVATSPLALDADSIDPALLEREREVYRQKAKEEGKPEAIIEKIADGAVKKYCKEVSLLDQAYIRDDKMSIADLVAKTGKEMGKELKVVGFTRVVLGE